MCVFSVNKYTAALSNYSGVLLAVLNETESSCVNTELYQRQCTTTMVGQCLLTACLMTCASVRVRLMGFFHMCYASVAFQKILNDLEWLSEVFDNMKHRVVSLRQLSLLFSSVNDD